MNTSEINRILRRNQITSPFYIGCFAADQLPEAPSHFPCCMVVNTDPGWAKGTHWVSIYCLGPNKAEYYAPLGLWAPLSEPIRSYLARFENVRFSELPIQSVSTNTCGKHAIFYLYHRCSGVPMDTIVHWLSFGVKNADLFVSEFIAQKVFI